MKQFYFRVLYVLTFSLLTTLSQAQIAQQECKFLGNIVKSSVPSDFMTYWNQITPENSGKWESVEAVRNTMNWTDLDVAYNYAQTHGLPFKQHTFVWGNQQPTWIESLTPEEQLAEIEEWIAAYCDRYPNTAYIDVVNEPLHDPPSGSGNGNYIEALGGNGTTGWDWVVKSFELAREHCPDAQLLINEYSVINNSGAAEQYKQIINILKDRQLVDGIGVQGHYFELENVSNATLDANLDVLASTGLPIYISELDLGNSGNATTQLELYQRIFPLLWEHPAVHGITLWGYRKGEIWVENAYLKDGGTERPALQWLETFVPTADGGVFCYTGADDEEVGLSVHPNPVDNGRVTVTSETPIRMLTIIDSNGRSVGSLSGEGKQSLDLELTDRAGLYLVRIETARKTHVRKVVIK